MHNSERIDERGMGVLEVSDRGKIRVPYSDALVVTASHNQRICRISEILN